MATVVRFPQRQPKFQGLGQMAGLMIGQQFRKAREKERARNTIEAWEELTGEDFDQSTEEALVDQGATIEDLAAFTAERRARSQERRHRELHPLRVRETEEGIESQELSQRMTEQQLEMARRREEREQEAHEREGMVQVTAFQPDTGRQANVRISREQQAKGELPQRLKDRGFVLGVPGEKEQDNTVEVTATNVEQGREAKVRISREAQQAGQLPQDLREQGWVLGKMSEAMQGSTSTKERLITTFINARGGDPNNSTHREQARAIIDDRGDAVERIERTYGTETPSGFAFPGKRAKLANEASKQVSDIMWNKAMRGETISPERAASIAMQRAEEDLGPVGEPTPEEGREQELDDMRASVEEAEEPVLSVPLFGDIGGGEIDIRPVGQWVKENPDLAKDIGAMITRGKLNAAKQEILNKSGGQFSEDQVNKYVVNIASD